MALTRTEELLIDGLRLFNLTEEEQEGIFLFLETEEQQNKMIDFLLENQSATGQAILKKTKEIIAEKK